MARQAIPRFDLYGELGVSPSADDETIEAAYRALTWRDDPDVVWITDERRLSRLRVAHSWLLDSERRSRYDASRARAAARAAGAAPKRAGRSTTTRKPGTRHPEAEAAMAPAPARTELTPDEAAAAEAAAALEAAATADVAAAAEAADLARARASANGPGALSWPAADLERARRRAVEPAEVRPSRRILLGVGGLAAIVVIAAVAVLALSMSPASPGLADASPTAPSATASTIAATPSPEPASTVAVTLPPPTTAPVDIAAMQQSAWNTIQALAAAAKAGDVATAQTMLGDTAHGLRASGLRRAHFPTIEPADLGIQLEGALYVATTAAGDRLTSNDGLTWTFDYADRPLAAYPAPAGSTARDLFWIEKDGKHHLYVRVAWVTVSRSGVQARVSWSFDPSRPDDATYFGRSEVRISSLALGSTETTVATTPLPMAGTTTVTLAGTFSGPGSLPSSLTIGITVTNPRLADGSDRAIESTWELAVR